MTDALAWALLHSLWQATAAALAVAILRRFVDSPVARYVLAWSALAAVVLAFGWTAALAWPSPNAAPSMRLDGALGLALPPIPGAEFPAGGNRAAWAVPLWAFGAAVVYAWHFAGWLALQRLRRGSHLPAPVEWVHRLEVLGQRLGLRRAVALYESALVDVPVVFGHLRPVLLMPAGLFLQMPAAQLEAILLHELAHIRRHDYVLNLIQRLIEGWFYYHPAVWWISGIIRQEREFCCDDIAASAGLSVYAEALLALEQRRQISPTAALAATGGNLMLRLQRLLDPAKPRHKARTGSPVAFALFLLFSLAAVLPAWQPPAAEPPSPYSLWLNQDVVYIISDAERDAFLRLSSAEEREKFIEQFWQRRDPTPATPHENQAKEEHYRRIGYANARFATKAKSGWRTERGRMYIVYGPPDELESHPSGQGGKPPREAWLYHQIKGLGDNLMLTFVDTEGNGDYRLAPGKAR